MIEEIRTEERHVCIASKEGDEFVYTCPQCDYVRRFNQVTRTMKVTGGEWDVLHSGFYDPYNIKNINSN